MKRGAKPKFNELGSSPVKGKGDNLKRIMSERKALAKKTGTFYAPGAEPNLPKGSNYPKGFNYKGSSASTTPKYTAADRAKNVKLKAWRKEFDIWQEGVEAKHKASEAKRLSEIRPYKGGKEVTSKVSKASKLVKGAKKVLKAGGRVAGGLGVAATLYDMYKSGQKHSGGKAVKGQKTGVVAPKKSIWNKKK